MPRLSLPRWIGFLALLVLSFGSPVTPCPIQRDPARDLELNLKQIESLKQQLLTAPQSLELLVTMAQVQGNAARNAALVARQDLLRNWEPADHIRPHQASLEAATPWIDQLIEHHPEAPEAWTLWARHQPASERLGALVSATERVPGNAELHGELLEELVEREDFDEAVDLQRRWMRADWPAPDSGGWHLSREENVAGLAFLLSLAGRLDEARDELEVALQSATAEGTSHLLQAFDALDLDSPLARAVRELADRDLAGRATNISSRVWELSREQRHEEAAALTSTWVEGVSDLPYSEWPLELKLLFTRPELTTPLKSVLQRAADSFLQLDAEEMINACDWPLPTERVIFACSRAIRNDGTQVSERFQRMLSALDRHPRLAASLLEETSGELRVALTASAAASNPDLCDRTSEYLADWQPVEEDLWKAGRILNHCSNLSEAERSRLLESSLLLSCERVETFASYADESTWMAPRITEGLGRCLTGSAFSESRWHLLSYLPPDARIRQQLEWFDTTDLPPAQFVDLLRQLVETEHPRTADVSEAMLQSENPDVSLQALNSLPSIGETWTQALHRLGQLATTPHHLAKLGRWSALRAASNGELEEAVRLYETFLVQAASFEDTPKATAEYLHLLIAASALDRLAGILEEIDASLMRRRISEMGRFQSVGPTDEKAVRQAFGIDLPIEDRIARLFKRVGVELPVPTAPGRGQTP